MGSQNSSPVPFEASPEPSEGRQKEASQPTIVAFPAKPEDRVANNKSSIGQPFQSFFQKNSSFEQSYSTRTKANGKCNTCLLESQSEKLGEIW